MGTGEKPDLSDPHQFGCTAWVKNLNAGKLDPRTVEGQFLGYDEESSANLQKTCCLFGTFRLFSAGRKADKWSQVGI
jgi:hypothetical protein